jgi:type VI protein secretion system component Hcp
MLRWLGWVVATAILGLPLWYQGLCGAIYLQLDGIPGDVQDKEHGGWIEVLSFDWDARQPTTLVKPSGPLDIKELTLHKFIDKASPLLMESLYKGHQIESGKIHFTEPSGVEPRTVLAFDLSNILVTGYATGGSGGEDRLLDSIHLVFDDFHETIYNINPDGTPADSSSVFWTVSDGSGGVSDSTTTNTAPALGAIPNTATAEDTPKIVSFTIGDGQTPSGALLVSRGSSDPLLVPVSNIILGGSGNHRTATITPAPNQSGTAVIQIALSDGVLQTEGHFTLTVTPVNDPPGISPLATQITKAGQAVTLNVTLSDIDSNLAGVTLAGTSNNPALLPNSNVLVTGNDALRKVTLSPLPGLAGEAMVTLTASDDAGASAATQFLLVINPVGAGGPTDIALNSSTVAENSPGGTLVANITVSDPDPGDVHTLTLTDSSGGRFVIVGNELQVAAGADLNFEASPTHVIGVRAADPAQQAFSKTFTISLLNINEAPKIVLGTLPTASSGKPGVLTGIAVSDVDAGTAAAAMVMEVSNGTLTINTSGPLADRVADNGSHRLNINASLAAVNAVLAGGGLVYQSAGGFAGTETLVILIDDLGASGAGGPQHAKASADFNVASLGFDAFRNKHFSAAELLDQALSGADADPDHDRLANLGEYALGGNPRDGSDAGRLVERIWIDDTTQQRRPALRFLRRSDDPRLSVVVEVATDVVNWHSGSGFTSEVEVLPDVPGFPGFERITVRSERSSSAEPRQMLRLRISQRP